MSQARVLIVHPEPTILALLGSMLQSLGHQIDEASNDRAAVRRMERGGIDLIIAGIDPFDPEALELLSFSRRKHPQVPVILLFPGPHPERAREATRMGATAVLKFPMPATELRAAVTQACERPHASAPSSAAHSPSNGSGNGNGHHGHPGVFEPSPTAEPSSRSASIVESPPRHEGNRPSPSVNFGPAVLGEDPTLRQAVELASTVAPARATVLIVGEQGTGKTLIARSIHQQSGRRDQPFLEVSCGGIDDLGLEREIFGQRFEGESDERQGRLARAHRGTLLLDEVASLSPALQGRLLRVLMDGEFEPMGSNQAIQVDVRFVLATRENLPALVEQGKFRRDLFERINDICLKLPPLRQRGHDVILLAENFRDRFARDFGKPVVGFSPDAQDLLLRHDWPGNVRELESVIQRGVALSQGPRVTSANLAVGIAPSRNARPSPYAPRLHMHAGLGGLRPLKEALEEPEKQIIIAALQALNWNRQETARVLDINRTTLYKKMKKYGLLMEEPALLN
jgi:two-component system response regulator HydG